MLAAGLHCAASCITSVSPTAEYPSYETLQLLVVIVFILLQRFIVNIQKAPCVLRSQIRVLWSGILVFLVSLAHNRRTGRTIFYIVFILLTLYDVRYFGFIPALIFMSGGD